MRFVGFLRNPWKKREETLSDSQDNVENSCLLTQKTTDYATNASAAAGHNLKFKVECLPLDVPAVSPVEGSRSLKHPLPIQDGSPQKRSQRTLIRRDTSRLALDATYHAHGAITTGGSQKLSQASNPTEASSKKHLVRSPSPASRNTKKELLVFSSTNHSTLPRQSPSPFSPKSPKLPSFPLLPPIDLDYGPGSKFDRLLESKGSQPPKSTNDCCPKFKFSDAQKSTAPTTFLGSLHATHKAVNSVSDLSLDAKPRILYRSTSTPHLPYHEQVVFPARPESPGCSGESSDAENFPLSLFPVPPPLLVRKKIPAPLVLRSGLPSSAVSSRDTTPIGTPTTPRFQSLNSPSQRSITSPKKFYLSRTSGIFSPPPTNPPNTPLPDLPASRNISTEKLTRTLRITQSNDNLRGAFPYPATHRFTSSEPISDHSSLPIKRSMKPRPDSVGIQDSYTYMVRMLRQGVLFGGSSFFRIWKNELCQRGVWIPMYSGVTPYKSRLSFWNVYFLMRRRFGKIIPNCAVCLCEICVCELPNCTLDRVEFSFEVRREGCSGTTVNAEKVHLSFFPSLLSFGVLLETCLSSNTEVMI